mgnify:CR=1 FL=1
MVTMNRIGVLRPLDNANEIRACFEGFHKTLTGEDFAESTSEKHPPKRPAPREEIEYRIGPDHSSSGVPHYICILSRGSQDLLQINHSRAAADKGVAGRYLRDDEGNFYIGHVGNIKFKKRPEGFSPAALRASSLGGSPETVVWQNGHTEEVLVLGRVGSQGLWRGILNFLDAVLREKELRHAEEGDQTPSEFTFTPEAKPRKSYTRPETEVDAKCIHRQVIDALERAVRKLGLKAVNDQKRDLFIATTEGNASVLFEAKSKISSQDIYTAIGQLMFHGALQESPPKRVLVIPGTPEEETANRLERLGIEVLEYDLSDTGVSFEDSGLRRLLGVA